MKRLAVVFALLLVLAPLYAQLTPKAAPNARLPMVGDVDGDGLADVIDDVTWQRNTGGALAAAVRLPIAGRVLGVLDANGDGVADLLTTDEPFDHMPPNGPYWLYLNDGHGNFVKFAAPTAVLPPAVNGPVSLPPFIADFDGDGKDDFILPYPHGFYDSNHFDYAFYRSRGDGTFEQTDFVQLTIFGGTPRNGGGRQRMTAGDVNGDGKPDIVIMLGSSLLVLAGRGEGKFEPLPERFTSGWYGSSDGDNVKVADIDGDRKNDVVSYGEAGVAVFFGDGHGGFPRMAVARAGACAPDDACPYGATLALIHFTSTQRWDIALGSPGANVSVMTYSNGALREATRIQLMPIHPLGGVLPPFNYYDALTVFAGKFRSDSPADLYAFANDMQYEGHAFLVFQDKAAEEIAPPRRRAAGRPGGSAEVSVPAGSFAVRLVPGYVDLFLAGRCYGASDRYELQRDGIFATGKTKDGMRVDAIIESPDVIRFGTLTGSLGGNFHRVGDGHYKGVMSLKTPCASETFEIEVDAFIE